MRFVFIDVLINGKYRMEDIFDFPTIVEKSKACVIDRYFDNLDATDDACDKMSIYYQIVKELLCMAAPKEKIRNEEIFGLLEYISHKYMENITVEDMARLLNMSQSHFFAVFKKSLGISPIKYLNDYRLSLASERLVYSDDSIKSIAESVGIYDRFYFSRLFKAKYAVSPQRYRKEGRSIFVHKV